MFAAIPIAIGAVVIAVWCWHKSAHENQDVGSVDVRLDEQYRQLIIGTWQDDFKGRRKLTVRDDGTATMVVEPDGVNSLFAAQLTFEEQWSIEGDRLRLNAIGGEPESRVNLILKMMGTQTNQKILELTTERLLLLDDNGQTVYDWRRMQ